jgi:Spy/CpxP family protein refolding chaperone
LAPAGVSRAQSLQQVSRKTTFASPAAARPEAINKEKHMKKLKIAAAGAVVAIAFVVPCAFAQTKASDTAAPTPASRGYGMGAGMMGGYGANGSRYGPGMMHGDGPDAVHGHDIMGSHHADMMGGCGPGMMGGYGPGMMGGYGPGMMGGYGPGMMEGHGAGMMGMGAYFALDLSEQQRVKIAQIREEARKKNWDAMGKVIEATAKLRDLYAAQTHDPAAIGMQTLKIAELRRPIIESMVETRDRIDALLTQEQRDRLHSFGPGSMMGRQ